MKTTKKIWAQCKNFVKLCDILKRKDFKICFLISNSNVGREFQFHFKAQVVTSVHLIQHSLPYITVPLKSTKWLLKGWNHLKWTLREHWRKDTKTQRTKAEMSKSPSQQNHQNQQNHPNQRRKPNVSITFWLLYTTIHWSRLSVHLILQDLSGVKWADFE